MRLLVLDPDRTGLDLCYRAACAGHDVRWWTPPNKDRSPVRTGDGFVGIERVTSWQQNMTWAKSGLIVNLYNEPKMTTELDKYRAFGFPVFGPSAKSAALEINRGEGMKCIERMGIEVPAYHTFPTLDAALAFAWKAQEPYVFKTLGDEEDKSLSYVASDPADLVGWILMKKQQGLKLKGPCMLQEKIDMICECGISAWMGKDGFLPGKFNVNFEHKKLMPGDFGQNTGEMGCYSDDTEVLTDSGWKFWPDVTMHDRIASLVAGKTVFQAPSAVVSYDYVGPMVCWENQTIDICVTPNHNMYVNRQHAARLGREEYEFIQAEDCSQAQYEVQRTAGWDGVAADFHEIPACEYRKGLGVQRLDPLRFPMVEWARFVGFYIAEGWANEHFVMLAQSHPVKAAQAQCILDDVGIPYVRSRHGFRIGRAQIARHLQPLGRAWEKRVPEYIKSASPPVIEAFLEGYALGDASHQQNGFRIFYTCSEKLAGDVQELLLKIGRVGVVKKRNRMEHMNVAPDGHMIVQRRPAFEVVERVKKVRSWLDARDRTTRMYGGKVYCATVPGHVMYVRRNGKPVWCGNTVTKYVEDGVLSEMLLQFEDYFVQLGHLGDTDIGCGIDSKGRIWPFEFSMRMGWPSTFILIASHAGDPIEWMRDAIDGIDSLEVDTRVAMGVVMAKPPFPLKNDKPATAVGYPVEGLEEVWDHVSPVELMIEKGPCMKDGKVAEGPVYKTTGDYVCCVTALAPDVHDVIPECYAAVDRIKFADRIVRNDIGARLEKELPKLHALGFTEMPHW